MRSPLWIIAAGLAEAALADGVYAAPNGACAGQNDRPVALREPCRDFAAMMEANLQKTVSLNFSSIEVRSLLSVLSDVSDVYMYATQSVHGSIAITVSKAPVQKVLADLTQRHRWVYKTIRDSVLVGPAAEVDEALEKQIFR